MLALTTAGCHGHGHGHGHGGVIVTVTVTVADLNPYPNLKVPNPNPNLKPVTEAVTETETLGFEPSSQPQPQPRCTSAGTHGRSGCTYGRWLELGWSHLLIPTLLLQLFLTPSQSFVSKLPANPLHHSHGHSHSHGHGHVWYSLRPGLNPVHIGCDNVDLGWGISRRATTRRLQLRHHDPLAVAAAVVDVSSSSSSESPMPLSDPVSSPWIDPLASIPQSYDSLSDPFNSTGTSTNRRFRKFFIETHGCQMNLADSDVVRAVLLQSNFVPCDVLEDADLIMINTCAVRENAEAKIWQRIKYFASLRKPKHKQRQRQLHGNDSAMSVDRPRGYPLIGILGCMGERLKERFLDESAADFVVGPDAYRELPTVLSAVMGSDSLTQCQTGQQQQEGGGVKVASVQLSTDETYADIRPMRVPTEGGVHAFVSIARGCNNHCAFCVVPYTRGVERSRPMQSVLDEVRSLVEFNRNIEEGTTGSDMVVPVREVVLLGQNVNSYWDRATLSTLQLDDQLAAANIAPGFSQRSKPKPIAVAIPTEDTRGIRFGELLLRVSEIDPEMRIRFQSPHPKDFPDDVLRLIAETPNICKSLHMPAQHGSTSMLERMFRGYSREAYLELVGRARSIIGAPRLGLSTDLIVGFCGETDKEHSDTLQLVREAQFDQAYTYAYSMREQTYAGLFYKDDVPEDVKAARLRELVDIFQETIQAKNIRSEVGRLHLVLVEGPGQRKVIQRDSRGSSESDDNEAETEWEVWTGRTDSNKRLTFSAPTRAKSDGYGCGLLSGLTTEEAQKLSSLKQTSSRQEIMTSIADIQAHRTQSSATAVQAGSYVIVKVIAASGQTLRGVAVAVSSIAEAHKIGLDLL